MSEQLTFAISKQIQQIEQLRDSKVLVLAASHLDMEILPLLYEQLLTIGKTERLDVILHCRGGIVNAARRIAILLRQFTQHLSFIVPYYCESSATILVLAADEIIAGDLAIFSPIDPHLQGESSLDNETPSALSCLDIKMFAEMSQTWFGVENTQACEQPLSVLCNNIFPPTLTAFYRTTLEVQKIAEELIAFQLKQTEHQTRSNIVNSLLFNYHSHHYAITADEMKALGLTIHHNTEVQQLAWQVSKVLQTKIGAALRQTMDDPWYDVLLASQSMTMVRQNKEDGFMPSWIEAECL